jgi:hypothetical protein
VDWLSPLVALIGVFAGAFLTRNAAETTWLRETRIERYSTILHDLDALIASLDSLFETLASPHAFEAREAWQAAVDQHAAELAERAEKVRWTAAELSLFTSAAVSARVTEILSGFSMLLSSFQPAEATDGGEGVNPAAAHGG